MSDDKKLRVEIYPIDDRDHNPGQWFVGLYQGASKTPLFNSGPFPTSDLAQMDADNKRSALGLFRSFDVALIGPNNMVVTSHEILATSMDEATRLLAKYCESRSAALNGIAEITLRRRP